MHITINTNKNLLKNLKEFLKIRTYKKDRFYIAKDIFYWQYIGSIKKIKKAIEINFLYNCFITIEWR